MQPLHLTIVGLLLRVSAIAARAPTAIQVGPPDPLNSKPQTIAARQVDDQVAPFTLITVTIPLPAPSTPPPAPTSLSARLLASVATPPPAPLASSTTIPDLNTPPSTTTTSTIATSTSTKRNHNIAVSLNGTTFTPSTLKNIPLGDTLTFYFYPSNFSFIQSTFTDPCQPLNSSRAVFSGFHPSQPGSGISREKFIVTVTSAEPMFLYGLDGSALQSAGDGPGVCERGMSMVVNPLAKKKAGGQTLSMYRTNAAGLDSRLPRLREVPAAIFGGEVRGVSDKEKARWEGKHPLPGGTAAVSGTGNATFGDGDDVAQYQNGAGALGMGSSLVGFAVLAVACVFGVGL